MKVLFPFGVAGLLFYDLCKDTFRVSVWSE